MKKSDISILLILCALLSVMVFRLSYLQKQVIPWQIADSISAPEGENPSQEKPELPEDESLFLALWEAGLISPLDDDRLEMNPPDHFLIQKAKNPDTADTEEMKEQEKLLKTLYHSPPGNVIRNQVRLWNETRFIAAIRDNRPGAAEHRGSQWQVYESENPEWQFPRTGNLVPENFGYVNQGVLTPGYTDWITAFIIPPFQFTGKAFEELKREKLPENIIDNLKKLKNVKYAERKLFEADVLSRIGKDASAKYISLILKYASNSVEFRSTVEAERDMNLTVQVIGKPVPPLPHGAGKPEPCCSSKTEECTTALADAFQILIPLKTGKNSLTVRVSPIKNNETEVAGLLIRKVKKEKEQKPAFTWFRAEPPEAALIAKNVSISTADDHPLTDEKGNPTKECLELGLLPLVGLGEKTRLGLWNILSHSYGTKDNINLSIDSRIQKAAQGALEDKIGEFWPNPENDNYAAERKAALIVLNAETGAILAAAGYPKPPVGVHPWDLASFAKVYPIRNPMQVRGWQGVDGDYTPGSTFKPVVALAAMTAAEKDGRISDFLKGYPANGFEKNTGLTLDCAAYNPSEEKCVASGSKESIRNYNSNSLRSAFGHKNAANRWENVVGLRQAVRDSINVWFVRLAWLTDGEKAADYDRDMENRLKGQPKPAMPDFQLVKTARELGFGDTPAELAAAPEGVSFALRKKPGKEQEGDLLFGNTGKATLMTKKHGLTRILAQNSIGQGVTATPLQMARVAAAIRKGEALTPYLIQWEKEMKTESRKLDTGDFSLLREGMKAVPQSGGTAGGAFQDYPEIRDNVYGKTGTANIGKQREYFTAWFVGWNEKLKGNPDIPSLAFACMVSHTHGEKYTGGSVAAPVIAEMLRRINKKSDNSN
ncbi:MAG: penicillin-binding transpeptidase domain-containing protein [Desulfococcaceae bacterium]|nr:penicillin-binding transpeptidase domain-containing protein [Desulfococcaceae bacterium]